MEYTVISGIACRCLYQPGLTCEGQLAGLVTALSKMASTVGTKYIMFQRQIWMVQPPIRAAVMTANKHIKLSRTYTR